MARRAVVLLSGGMDSTTVLAQVLHDDYEVYALSFRYGQRHAAELHAAERILAVMKAVSHRVMPLDLSLFGGSALTDHRREVPDAGKIQGIPPTYVPARNLIFLSVAVAWAETIPAWDVFIGANQVDYPGYPDCRGEFLSAFETAAGLGTRSGAESHKINIHAPLLNMTKAEIIRRGASLGVDYALTVSCYRADGNGRACGVCDACSYRKQGFADAALPDVTHYY